MFGLASGDTDTTWYQVVGTIFILWISTGIFVVLTLAGIGLTVATWE